MSNREDLDWLAFRYVADELDAADARAFELRLSGDQDAREAVARAYALARCILAVECERPDDLRVAATARRSLRLRRLSAAAIGLAACLLLTLATLRLPRPEDSVPSAAVPSGEPNDTDRLAMIWSETRQPLDDPLWPPEQLDDESIEGPVAMAGLSIDDDWIGIAVMGMTSGE